MHRDGTLRDVRLVKVAVPGDDGRPAGILVVLMDVSEFRAAEAPRATRATPRRPRAPRASSSPTSATSCTPLQSILGFS